MMTRFSGKRISVTFLARNLADVMNRVAYRGEEFAIIRGNREIAQVLPSPRGKPLSELSALLKSLPPLSEEDASIWAEELESARSEVGWRQISSQEIDRWES